MAVTELIDWRDINKILKYLETIISKVEELEKKVAKLESWRMVDDR